jgi:curved DNA-binding protein CbpA
VRELDTTLPLWATGNRSPTNSDSLKLKDLGARFYRHSKNLQRLLDQVKGRADWSTLSLNVPEPKLSKSPGVSPKSKTVSFGSPLSSEGRATPPSPYQAPTVEDVEDSGELDEDHSPSFDHYHVDPPLFPSTPTSKPALSPSTPNSKPGAGNHGTPSPPRVVLRSPTDPETLKAHMETLHFQDDDPPIETKDSTTSHFSAAAWDDAFTSRNLALNTQLDSPSQSMTPQRRQTDDERQAEILRLTSEIERLKATESAISSSSSRHSPSRSIDGTPQYMHPPRASRPRASTTTGADRRPAMKMGGGGSPRNNPRPHVSPRYSPASPPESSPRYKSKPTSQQQREWAFGVDANKSLPTILEPSLKPESRRLGVGTDYRKRASCMADDFSHYHGPDPPMFNTSGEPSARPTPTRTSLDKDDLRAGVTRKKIPITLEDMFFGSNKKVRFKRSVPDDMDVRLVEDVRILTVAIYPGLRPGSLLKYPGEGDYNPATGRLGDMWFALHEQEHPVFSRHGDNLHMSITVSLCDALCGWTRTVKSICGREVKVKHSGPTAAGWKECFAGLGLPTYDGDQPEKGGERGDLIVEVKVAMPARLDERQKTLIQRALGSDSPRAY